MSAILIPQLSEDDQITGAELRRSAFLTAAMGIAHSVLFLTSYWLITESPGAQASDGEILSFYTDGERRRLIVVGLYVMPFAGMAFIWFSVALRTWIRYSTRRVDQLYSTIQLYSGILYVGLCFVAAAAASITAASVEFSSATIDVAVARQFPQFSSTILLVFAMRMAAMFVFATSNIGRSTGLLPRWFIFLGMGVGVFLLLSASFSGLLVLVFPVWLAMLCTLLILRARAIPAHLPVEEILQRRAESRANED